MIEWHFFVNSQLVKKGKPYIIAGPCSAESREQVLSVAGSLSDWGVDALRAGAWKPRTHPGCFEGVGEKALAWLVEARERFGLKVCTEVASSHHVECCLKAGIDILWIGARTTVNPFLVQEISDALRGTDAHVLVKNPVSPDIELWSGAVERLSAAGLKRIGLIHRGFTSSSQKRYRNDPQWHLAIEMRSRFPGLPIICDSSHIAGKSCYVGELSQRAMDLGFDGLMVECHDNPSCALSDAAQQLTPESLKEMLSSLTLRSEVSDNALFNEKVRSLRSQIDSLDDELVSTLARRMEISREIGRCKKENNVSIVQLGRWQDLLADVLREGESYGLDRKFLSDLFSLIHEASISQQDSNS